MNLESEILQVHLEDIIPNRFQPRLAFDEQGLKELAASIKEHGIIQPLVLRKLGDKFEIIAGERRYKAATMAGLTTVPAVISDIDDNTSAEVALVENVQRKDLTPIEEARSYKNLLDKGYLTQDELAKRMGLSQSSIANKLRLLNLDDKVQQALLEEKISERHARALLTLPDKNLQQEWLDRVIRERMTVRQLDAELKKINGGYVADEIEEIPVVDSTINLDEIRNKATDIKPQEERPSAASMMLPENIMTEYSDSLPGESSTPSNQPINDQPVIQFNPLNSEDLQPTKPLNNKFFDFSLDYEQLPTQAETTEMAPPPVEIFDSPLPNPTQQFSEANNIVPGTFQEQIEPITIPEESNNLPEVSQDNRFFTPATADIPEQVQAPTPEIIDPVASISNLDETNIQKTIQDQQLNFGEAISEIRDLVTNMSNRGIVATIEEADLEGSYRITINIDK